MLPAINTKEIQRSHTFQRALQKDGLELIFEKWNRPQELKRVGGGFSMEETHVTRAIQEKSQDMNMSEWADPLVIKAATMLSY